MYFQECKNVIEIKNRYRNLAMQWHPDRNPDKPEATRVMQEINAAYEQALKGQHEAVYMGFDKQEHTYFYNEAEERLIMAKLAELIALRLPDDVDILLVGTWIWVEGNTKPVKDYLKAAGLNWHAKRQRWYFRMFKYRRKMSNFSFDDIKGTYGSRQFASRQEDLKELG